MQKVDAKDKNKFWSMTFEEVVRFFVTDIEAGLSEEEVKKRLDIYGKNIIPARGEKSNSLKIFLSQLKSPLILVLIIAGFVTIFISDYRDSVFIFFAVIVNSVLGFYQENKAEKAISELKTYIKQRARVLRGGKEKEIPAEDLTLGDIIRLSQGDRISADGRIVYSNDFQVDEAILTGESLPEEKSHEVVSDNSTLADQRSMVFAGTLVVQGVCTAIVCRTGINTEIGKIAKLIESSGHEKTPLQKSITKFSIYLSLLLSLLTVAVFAIGIVSGEPFVKMFLTSVAVAVSAIPEGLPISMTVILAIGVQRMAKRKAVVRKLIAAEALGSTTTILTDKTGTLTVAKMALSKIIPNELDENKLLELALKNCDVLVENPEENPDMWRIDGKIMEVAIVRSAGKRGMTYDQITNKKDVLQYLPFNSTHKFSVSLIEKHNKHLLVFLGAPDILLSHSHLDNQEKRELHEKINSIAQGGERLLGLATKEINHHDDYSLISSIGKDFSLHGIKFEGLITFKDPLRPGIKNTVELVKSAGLKVVIITGDHKGTATSVAKEIGLEIKEGSVLDASEISALSDQELKKQLPDLKVISRVTPGDKLRIVKLYQELGETVAMTGDGVNDAPSLKQANVGIAMGSGTEVAQGVSDLVLLDDNFETIVAAIEEGRQILGNIKKVIVYLLSNVADGLILVGGSLVFGIPLPLNALQILWVNFFTDSFPAIAFAFEKDENILTRGIRHEREKQKEKLFDPMMKFLILVIGISTSLLLFAVYYVLLKLGYDIKLIHTFTFAAFGTYTLLVAVSVRSLNKSIFNYPIFSNIYMTLGIILGFLLMALAIYAPFFQNLFETVSLPFSWVVGVLGIGIINVFLIELTKTFFNRNSSV